MYILQKKGFVWKLSIKQLDREQIEKEGLSPLSSGHKSSMFFGSSLNSFKKNMTKISQCSGNIERETSFSSWTYLVITFSQIAV